MPLKRAESGRRRSLWRIYRRVVPDDLARWTLEIGDLSVVASIANCTQQPVVAADEMMRALLAVLAGAAPDWFPPCA